jgi:hypothetical protein
MPLCSQHWRRVYARAMRPPCDLTYSFTAPVMPET